MGPARRSPRPPIVVGAAAALVLLRRGERVGGDDGAEDALVDVLVKLLRAGEAAAADGAAGGVCSTLWAAARCRLKTSARPKAFSKGEPMPGKKGQTMVPR